MQDSSKKQRFTYSEEYMYQVYCERVKPNLDEVRRMFFEGYSFNDVAKELEVSSSLLWRMRKSKKTQYADLRDAFEFQSAQVQNVESTLYRKAVGFYYDEEQVVSTFKEYYNKKGKKCKDPIIKTISVRKYVEPDVNAIKFFLLNHAAKKYSPEGGNQQVQQEQIIESLKNVFIQIKKTADGQGDDEE